MKTALFVKKASVSCFLILGLVWATALCAQTTAYPNRPIKLVVPFVPGGTLDVVARLLGKNLSEAFGQAVIVDNKAGAGGVVGVDYVAKSAPDGYTLVLNSATPMVTVVSLQKTPYELLRDLAPVSQVSTFDYVLSVNAKSGLQNMQELVQWAKKQPGKLNYASAGTGSGQHMYMELAKSVAGVQLQHIPYKGAAGAATDVVGGQVPLSVQSMPSSIAFIRSNKLKVLGVVNEKRLSALPDAPTIGETIKGFGATPWYGMFAPTGTPKLVNVWLQTEILRILDDSDTKEKLATVGCEPYKGSADVLAALVRDDLVRWAKIVKDSGAKVD